MTEGRPPIALEHYQRLRILAKLGCVGLEPRLGLADGVALQALLNAWLWADPVQNTATRVEVAGLGVRLLCDGVQYGVNHVTVPMDFLPDDAERLSDALGEAAEFARMMNGQGGVGA